MRTRPLSRLKNILVFYTHHYKDCVVTAFSNEICSICFHVREGLSANSGEQCISKSNSGLFLFSWKVMKNIEAQINKFKGKSGKDAPSDKAGQQYRQWVEEVYKDSVAGGDRYMVTYAEHLREYHIALTLNANTRMKNAREYLTKYFEALDTEKFTETDKNLEKLFYKAMGILDTHIKKYGEPENPRLLKLQELLLDNYKDVERQQDNKDESGKKEGDGGSETEGRRDLVEENDKSCAQEQEVENEKVKNDAEKKEEEREREDEECATVLAEDTEKLNGEVSKENPSLEKTEELPPEAARSDHASTKPDDNQNILGESELEDSSANEKSEVKSEKDGAMPEQESQNNARSTSSEGTENDEGSSENGAHHPEWDGAKGILFTRTRESTIALFDWINETEELSKVLRPELLVGSGDGNSKSKDLPSQEIAIGLSNCFGFGFSTVI